MICFITIECRISDAQSLKDKRAVLKRVLTRARQKFNVSIAETGEQDRWQWTEISIAAVSSSKQALERDMNQLLDFLDSFPEWERIETNYEWL